MGKLFYRRSRVGLSVMILTALCFFLYDPYRLENTSGDTISARYWPVSILKYHTVSMNPFKKDLANVSYAAIFYKNGTEWKPRVNWGMAVFTVPFYWVAENMHFNGESNWTHEQINRVSRANAVFLASLSVLGMYLFLLRIVSSNVAIISALFFAFGTWNWSLGAQGLSTQTPVVLLHVVRMYLMFEYCKNFKSKKASGFALALGLCDALVLATRYSDFPLLIPDLFLLTIPHLIYFLISLLMILIPLALVNISYYDHFLGWGGILATVNGMEKTVGVNPLSAAAGLLFSPNRGALVFFPLLLLVPILWRRIMPRLQWRDYFWKRKFISRSSIKLIEPKKEIPPRFSESIAFGTALYFASLSFLSFWHSSWSYGPRYLYDFQPYFWPVFALSFEEVGKWLQGKKSHFGRAVNILFILFALQSVCIHALGHFNFDIYVWNFRADGEHEKSVWNYKDPMILEVWRAGSNRNRWKSALDRLYELGF